MDRHLWQGAEQRVSLMCLHLVTITMNVHFQLRVLKYLYWNEIQEPLPLKQGYESTYPLLRNNERVPLRVALLASAFSLAVNYYQFLPDLLTHLWGQKECGLIDH